MVLLTACQLLVAPCWRLLRSARGFWYAPQAGQYRAEGLRRLPHALHGRVFSAASGILSGSGSIPALGHLAYRSSFLKASPDCTPRINANVIIILMMIPLAIVVGSRAALTNINVR